MVATGFTGICCRSTRLAVEQLDLRGYDLVITSDAGPMKGVIVAPGAIHICYCHAPMRYIWNQYQEYRNELSGLAKCAFSAICALCQGMGFCRCATSDSVCRQLCKRVRSYSSILFTAEVVLYPPVDTSFARLETSVDDSYLAVGRLVAYKRLDLLIAACNRLGRKLRIIGIGPEGAQLARARRPVDRVSRAGRERGAVERIRSLPGTSVCGRGGFRHGPGGSTGLRKTRDCLRKRGRSRVHCIGKRTVARRVVLRGSSFMNKLSRLSATQCSSSNSGEQEFDPVFISDWAKRFDSAYFVDGFRELVNGAMAFLDEHSTVKNPGCDRHSQPVLSQSCGQRGA